VAAVERRGVEPTGRGEPFGALPGYVVKATRNLNMNLGEDRISVMV
jgi:hypothetical protein